MSDQEPEQQDQDAEKTEWPEPADDPEEEPVHDGAEGEEEPAE